MKNKILKLRSEGKTYKEIINELGCSKSTVSYYCGKEQKEKSHLRSKKSKLNNPVRTKLVNFKGRKKIVNGCKDFQARGENKNLPFKASDVFERFGENPKCYLTGRPIDFSNSDSFCFDHIIPVSQGGDNSIENLGLACPDANWAKSGMMLNDFLILCKEVLINHGFVVSDAKDEGIEPLP